MPRHLITFVLCALAAGCQFGGKKRPVGSVDQPIAAANSLATVEILNPVGVIRVQEADPQHAAGVSAEVLLDERRPETDFMPVFDQHVSMRRDGDRLSIRSAHNGRSDKDDWQLQMTVYLPAGVALKVGQDVGSVDVKLSATRALEVDLDTGSIDVAVPHVDGDLTVAVDTGRIDVATVGAMPTGDCVLSCDTGSITLRLPKDAGGSVDLATDCGTVDMADRFGLKTSREAAEAWCRGTFGNGDTKIRARVDTGPIYLR